MPSGRPKKPKTCVACGNEFMPRGGRATRCDECKKRAPRPPGQRPARTSSHDSQYKPGKASRLSIQKVMEIEASVARRIAEADDEEEDDGAT